MPKSSATILAVLLTVTGIVIFVVSVPSTDPDAWSILLGKIIGAFLCLLGLAMLIWQLFLNRMLGSIKIPVVIDSVKSDGSFQMTRCIFYSVESTDTGLDWADKLPKKKVLCLSLGSFCVICGPNVRHQRFDSPKRFEQMLLSVESQEALYVDINDIWLPNSVFGSEKQQRGNVYRLSTELFSLALQYEEQTLTQEDFLKRCEELTCDIKYSAVETESLSEWNGEQIRAAKADYKKADSIEAEKKKKLRFRETKEG